MPRQRRQNFSLRLLAASAALLWLAAFLLPAPPPLYAEVNYVPLAPIDVEGSEFTSPSYSYPGDPRPTDSRACAAPNCLPRYLRTVYNIGIALAGLFAVFSIMRGGFQLLFTDSILGHTEGRRVILHAVGGLIVVYSSFLLMDFVNPNLASDLDLSLDFRKYTPPQLFKNLPPPAPEKTKEEILLEAKAKRARNVALTSLELDALAKDYRATANAAGANNDEETAQTYRALATETELESLRMHTGQMLNTNYTRGLEAARTSEGDTNARLWIQSINNLAGQRAQEFVAKGEPADAATLYEEQMRTTSTIAQELTYRYMDKGQSSSVMDTVDAIVTGATTLINKLEKLKQSASAEDKPYIDGRIACVRRGVSDVIDNISSRCKEKLRFSGNPCDSYQNPFPAKPACTPKKLWTDG